MKLGEIVTTSRYQSANRQGRKMLIVDIQNNIELDKNLVSGFAVLKDGRVTNKPIKDQACNIKPIVN